MSKAKNKTETLRRLRLGNLKTLFRYRYGPFLPDDDAGREDLRELLLPISVGPNADIKMSKAIEVWAEWMSRDDAGQLIDRVNQMPIWERKPNGKELGERLRVTNAERERLRLWTIAACDMTPEEAAEWRKAKERARKRNQRKLRGSKPRGEYEASRVNRTKPWLALGISRTSWYRQRGTSASAVKLVKATDTPVSPEQAELPKRHKRELQRPEKPERQQYIWRCNCPRALRTHLSHEHKLASKPERTRIGINFLRLKILSRSNFHL